MAAITIPTIIFERAKRSNTNYLDTRNYDDTDVLDAVRDRSRFSSLNGLLNRISDIPDNKFRELFTPHFFISSKHKNDAYIAMLAIYYTILQKVDYIGDIIVSGTMHNSVDLGFGGFGGFQPQDLDIDDDDNDYELRRKGNPRVLDEFAGGYTSIEDLSASDPNGTDVLFYISNNAPRFGFAYGQDDSDEDDSMQEKLANDNNFIYVSMGSDSKDEISAMLSELLVKKGFDISKVESRLTKLIDDTDKLDEYTINSYARSIFNAHLLNDPDNDTLSPKDFQKIAVKKKLQQPVVELQGKDHKIVGLEAERSKIGGIVQMLDFEKKRREKGLCGSFNGCNMVFAGPPGTAKTTLAREFALKLEKLGLITSAANFTECKKSDIVGAYVGWTAMQVDRMFTTLANSGGGVIFFDEIYTLSEKQSTCYDTEAVTCIVQNMENYRDKVFCIFAGYENKMDEFLSANPGIRSRIHFNVKFSHYNNRILSEVFKSIAEGSGYHVPEGCGSSLDRYFDRLKLMRGAQFGNGREARNLFSNAVQKMAVRLSSAKRLSKRSLTHFTAEDIELAIEDILSSEIAVGSAGTGNHIGF